MGVFIGPSGISGYAPWATWLEILLIAGGATAAAIFACWLASRRKRRMASEV
jgi:uncharacterized membrane protein YqaE (UPF0057 family)